MQPIHIDKPGKRAAAESCHQVLANAAGAWLIWSVGDEGCMMAPASSRHAANIRKYWPETIAGEFSRRASRAAIIAKLIEARDRVAVRADNRTDERRAYESQYKARQRAKSRAAA